MSAVTDQMGKGEIGVFDSETVAKYYQVWFNMFNVEPDPY